MIGRMGSRANEESAVQTATIQVHERRWLSATFWRQRRVLLSVLAGLDALVVLYGTFIVWLLLGLSDWQSDPSSDVPDWISPTAATLGVTTAAITLLVARGALRQRPRTALIVVAVCLHLGLALATAVTMESALGAATLVAGAGIVWLTRTARPSALR